MVRQIVLDLDWTDVGEGDSGVLGLSSGEPAR
jgi:hypothetical protein